MFLFFFLLLFLNCANRPVQNVIANDFLEILCPFYSLRYRLTYTHAQRFSPLILLSTGLHRLEIILHNYTVVNGRRNTI